jgi:hypothetical protein
MAKRLSAARQSLTGIVHRWVILRSAKKINFNAASSVGNEPRFLTGLHCGLPAMEALDDLS